MKHIIHTFALLYFYSSFAQGNLQFNAAKYWELEGTSSHYILPNGNSGIFTIIDSLVIIVPPNKVLKIENVKLGSRPTGYNNSYPFRPAFFDQNPGNGGVALTLNGIPIYAHIPSWQTETNPGSLTWLPEGNYTIRLHSAYSSYDANNNTWADTQHKGFISAIEFNIIP